MTNIVNEIAAIVDRRDRKLAYNDLRGLMVWELAELRTSVPEDPVTWLAYLALHDACLSDTERHDVYACLVDLVAPAVPDDPVERQGELNRLLSRLNGSDDEPAHR